MTADTLDMICMHCGDLEVLRMGEHRACTIFFFKDGSPLAISYGRRFLYFEGWGGCDMCKYVVLVSVMTTANLMLFSVTAAM